MRNTPDFDPYKSLDRPEPNFELPPGREQRNADANDKMLKLGGEASASVILSYGLTGRHSLQPRMGDVIEYKPAGYAPVRGEHRADEEL